MWRNSSNNSSKTISIPSSCVGLLIGKSGSNIARLQRMPGIISVKLSKWEPYTVQVTGTSESAINTVLVEIRKLVGSSISWNSLFVPDFTLMCYQSNSFPATECIRLEPVKVSSQISSHILPSYDPNKLVFMWFPGDSASSLSRNLVDSVSRSSGRKTTRVTSKTTEKVISLADYSEVVSRCFSHLGASLSNGAFVKVEVKLGKTLFLTDSHEVSSGNIDLAFVDSSLTHKGILTEKFCDAHTIQDISSLAVFLRGAGYTKLPVTHKASLHLVDFKLQKKHRVSLKLSRFQVENILGLTGYFKKAPSMFKCDIVAESSPNGLQFSMLPKRHGFVVNMHEGKLADLRLSTLTGEVESAPSEELLACVDAWSSGDKKGSLRFDPEGRFHVSMTRYKEVHKFVCGDVLVRVAKLAVGEDDEYAYKWDVKLKSMWMKMNFATKDGLSHVDEALEHVQNLFEEGNRIVDAIGELHF